ncbi:2'-5' RNA ligase family protein [Sphaerochaeta sp. S2]|uniref:2'-5' RNA ligase family protein n=1 Tax=Sphaerochaeta sp. S2 TaxID=2798868 RepID=UPI0018E9612C|nr:2'-5' RNA ligase family protein [Sphaerochaeta sp. S2]MBJ2355159.1 2'-5' RNA ligase family protein [Sphaerochaeta sp. S2]
MIRRTIMLFPEFDNIHVIDEIRKKYDPLSENVRPHITLVFTFESDLESEVIKNHLEDVTKEFEGFQLRMTKIVTINNAFGKYLFLLIEDGIEEIKRLSSQLYTGTLAAYKPEWLTEETFLPHMTLGQFSTDDALEQAYEDVQKIHKEFKSVIRKVSVEIIDDNEDSIIDFEMDMK